MTATTAITALDVIAMSLLALIIGPALTGGTLKLPIIGELSGEVAPTIALIACVLIIVKSFFSMVLHWFATRKFAEYELAIGDRMFKAYIN